LTVVTGSPHCDVSAVVSGWSLIVVYELPSERLRAINLFHGLAPFRGGQHIQTPGGFRIPNSNIDGRVAVFTLEGDPANSTTQDGFDEALRFNGNLLNDGINVPGSDPLIQQYDGTINTQGISTSYGIDVDQYDVSAFLTPGPDDRHAYVLGRRRPRAADDADRRAPPRIRLSISASRARTPARLSRAVRASTPSPCRTRRAPASSAKTTSSPSRTRCPRASPSIRPQGRAGAAAPPARS
jgi:hypothetical protein